jgi:dienelactone hydrolase
VVAALAAGACGTNTTPAAEGGSSTAPATAAPPGTPPPTAAPVPGTVPVTSPPVAPSLPVPEPVATPGPTRNLPVAFTTVALVDASRATVSRGVVRARTRTLTTTVAAPAGPGPYPLVMFAHGFNLGPPAYRRLMEVVAAAGYVVAAPSFPLADAAVAGAAVDRGDIPYQSGDLAFVADELTRPPGRAGSPVPPDLRRRIDGSRIGAVGHSDGADTVLDLGYHRDRFDPRVRAVVALSPDAVPTPGGPAQPVPLLLVHGTADPVAPFRESTALFDRLAVPRWLVALPGADHLGPVQGAAPWASALDRAVLAVLDRFVAGSPPAPADDLDGVAADGVADVRTAAP